MEEIIYVADGMNSDSDPSLQPNNTYRFGLNGNLISEGNNIYSFESVKGTKVSFQLPEYTFTFSFLFSTTTYVYAPLIPIGFISLGDKLIVFSTNTTGGAQIGEVTFNDAGDGIYKVRYHDNALNFSLNHLIKGYGLIENESFHRVYWTDDYNQPRAINLKSTILNRYYQLNELVNGERYMVLTTTNLRGVQNGPQVYSISNTGGTNIFTYDSSQPISVIGTLGVDVFIIKYLSPVLLDFTPEKMNGTIDYISSNQGQGQVYTGVNQYCYRLYTRDGYYTSWSPLSNFVHVTDKNASAGYQQYQGVGASNVTVNSGKSITLQISDISTAFDKIQVGVFESHTSMPQYANNSIDAAYVFYDNRITGDTMTINHVGQENLLTLLPTDLLYANNAFILRCKDLVTLKQRAVMLNITERSDIADIPQPSITPFTYSIPADTTGSGSSSWNYQNPLNSSGGIPNAVHLGGHYIVKAGSITYNGVTYTVGQTFVGIAGIYSWSGSGTVKACIRIKKYRKANGVDVYKVIELNNEFWDYKSPAAQMNIQGYWRDQTYRKGLMFFDKFGNPFAVKWAGDVTTPKQSDTGFKLTSVDINGTTALNVLGLEFNNIDITDIINDIAGVAIVRAKRENTILAQGLLLPITQKMKYNGSIETNSGAQVWVPEAFPNSTYSDFNRLRGTVRHPTTIAFVSPETDLGFGELELGPPLSNDRIEAANLLGSLTFSAVQNMNTATEDLFNKLYYSNSISSSAYYGTIQKIQTFNTGSEGSFDSNTYFKNYDVPSTTNTGNILPSGGKRVGTGGKRLLIKYSPGPNSLNNIGQLVVNYKRSSSGLYGGQSAESVAATEYMYIGHYLKIDSTVLNDIRQSNGRYILNGVQVFGGDCFIGMYDRVHVVQDNTYVTTADGGADAEVYNWNGFTSDGEDKGVGSFSYSLIYPCESNVNFSLRFGNTFGKVGCGRTSPRIFSPTRLEQFVYNSVYSSQKVQVPYVALPIDFNAMSRFPYKARWSELKALGERQDNMRVFYQYNFKNVDALHGELTCGLVGADRLFYLQQRGVGYFPVEERELSVSALGSPINIGTGSIMNRADNIDSFYGCQHKFGVYTAEDHFAWFDFRRKTMLRMSFTGQVGDVSIMKGLSEHFNNAFKDVESSYSNIYNNDDLYAGFGVSAIYDSRHKMGLFTFKFKDNTKNYNFTIGYSSTLDKYVSFFSFTPMLYAQHNNKLFSTTHVNFDTNGIQPNTYYPQYAVVNGLYNGRNGYFVCNTVLGYTTGSVPVAPINDSTNWSFAGYVNEVHKYWYGDICKFFGITYPYQLEVVSKGADTKTENFRNAEKTFDNVELYGNNTMLTDVWVEDSKRIGYDIDIKPTNKNYKLVDNSIWFNIPLARFKPHPLFLSGNPLLEYARERMTDHYIKIKMSVKNYTNDLTVSLNNTKRIVYLRTIFRKRL